MVGEKSITGMICTLCDTLENDFGILTTRLYRVFKPRKGAYSDTFLVELPPVYFGPR